MFRRVLQTVLAAVLSVCVVQGCGLGGALFVSEFYTLTVLPPDGGGAHSVDPGDDIVVRVEVRMGDNVTGEDIFVTLDASTLPDGVNLSVDEFASRQLDDLGSNESAETSFTFEVDESAVPGSYELVFGASADLLGSEFLEDEPESATFTLVIAGPGDGGDGGTGGSSKCAEFIAHYNGLECVTDPLDEDEICTSYIEENCTGADAYNDCRIENSYCTDGQLTDLTDTCFELLSCDG